MRKLSVGLMVTLLVAAAGVLVVPHVGRGASGDVNIRTFPLQQLLRVDSDNTIGYEQIPEGVPGWYDWYDHAVTKDANNKTGKAYVAPWGYVYNVRTTNPLPKDRVELRDFQGWILSKSTDQWTPIWTTPEPIGGGLWPEDFVHGPILCAGLDTKTDPGSTISTPNVDCHGNAVTGHLWHFFGANANARMRLITPSDVAAVAVRVRARLATTNPRSSLYPGYIVCMGDDWWSAPAGGSASGAGSGRCVTVKSEWRTVVYTTETTAQIAANPLPPINDNLAELF